MAEERPTSRFRFLWGGARAEPSPGAATRTPTRSIGTKDQRSPWRRPGQSSTRQAQASPRTDSQPTSRPRSATQSRSTSEPASTSRGPAQPQTAAEPKSQSHAASKPQGASKSQSPSSSAAKPQPAIPTATRPQSSSLEPSKIEGQTSAPSSSPTPTATQAPPTAVAASQPPPPTKAAKQESSQPSATYIKPVPPVSQEPKPAASQLESQKSPREAEKVPTQLDKSSGPIAAAAPTSSAIPITPTTTHKSESSAGNTEGSQPPTASKESPSPVSQERPKPATSQLESQKLPEKAAKISAMPEKSSSSIAAAIPTSAAIPSTPATNHKSESSPVNAEKMPALPEKSSGPIAAATPSTAIQHTPATTHKSDSSPVISEPKPILESGGHQEMTERKEIAQDLGIKEDARGMTLGTRAPDRAHESKTFGTAEKELQKDEVPYRKNVATAGTNGKQSEGVTLYPKGKNTVSESGHKPTVKHGEQPPMHREIREDIARFVHKTAIDHPIGEKQVTVITLAGENRGASMQLGSEMAKGAIHIHRGYKVNQEENEKAKTDGENQEMRALINSNVQGINNSIVFNSSIAERDPGVQLVPSSRLEETVKSAKEIETLETHKAEFNVTPAQQLTYKSNIRRRCLRGLFMEPSDSDSDNPEKPRHHGCRYICREKNQDNEINIQ